MTLIDEAADKGNLECEICGGIVVGTGKRCKGCVTNYVTPGTHLDDNRLDVVLPLNEGDVGAAMLIARGYNPDEWVEERLIVNDWESQIKGGAKVTLHQTKISYVRKIELKDTPMGAYVEWVESREPVIFTPLPKVSTDDKKKTFVALGDHQAPYVDHTLHELTCEMLSALQPDGIIYMGDGPDFDSISRHRKKQGTDFLSTVQDGIDSMHSILEELMDAAQSPQENYYLIGNHDVRIETVVTDKVPDLFGVRRANCPDEFAALSIPNLLRLGELGFEVVTDSKGDYPHGRVVLSEGNEEVPPLVASHGWIARKGAGNSARHSIDNLNASIIVGHTHRLGISAVTRWHETGSGQEPRIYTAAESGAMCDGQGLGYSKYPDWQPGFLVVDLHPNGDYEITMASKRGSSLRWGGMMWTRTPDGLIRSS